MGNINWTKWLKWILIAIVLWLIWRAISNRLDSPKPPQIQVVNPGGGSTTPVPVAFKYDPAKVVRSKPFGVGTTNSQEVAYLQTWLNQYYSAGLAVDGDWGAKTTAAMLLHKPLTNMASTTLNALEI